MKTVVAGLRMILGRALMEMGQRVAGRAMMQGLIAAPECDEFSAELHRLWLDRRGQDPVVRMVDILFRDEAARGDLTALIERHYHLFPASRENR